MGLFDHDEVHLLKEILRELREERQGIHAQLKEITRILRQLVVHKAVSATLTYTTDQGEQSMASTPLALLVGQTASPTFTEWSGPNGTGTPLQPVGQVTYADDGTGVISTDPSTGIVTGVSPTAAGAVATVTGTDAGDNLTAQATFTVSAPPPPPAVSATLTYTANPLPASLRAKK